MKPTCIIFALFALMITSSFAGRLDPLDPSEHQNVQSSAQQHNDQQIANNGGFFSFFRSQQNADYELLLVERHRLPKDAVNRDQRLADVYWYDYARDMLVKNLVDVSSQDVISSEESQGTQLPLTQAELQKALDILFADQTATNSIATEYQDMTGDVLSDYANQVEMKAFVFHAKTAAGQLQSGSVNCGINRCAQIMLFTPERVAFEVMPVVNLSTNQVTDILAGF